MSITITPELKDAIERTWQAIAHDIIDHVKSNEDAIELVVDSGALEVYGGEAEWLALRELFKLHGSLAVLAALESEIRLF